MNLDEYELAIIEWNDALGIQKWQSIDDVVGIKPSDIFYTIGCVINEDDDYILLSSSLHAVDGDLAEVSNMLYIPRGMVKRIIFRAPVFKILDIIKEDK